MDATELVGFCCPDFRKTFFSADLQLLTGKPQNCRISLDLVKWVAEFLHNPILVGIGGRRLGNYPWVCLRRKHWVHSLF